MPAKKSHSVDSPHHLRYSLVLAQFRACVSVCLHLSHSDAHPEGPSASSLRRSREPKGFSPWEVAPGVVARGNNTTNAVAHKPLAQVNSLSSTRFYWS